MGATFNRLKNWTTEILSNVDLNAEIDNILNNLGPAGIDDYSTNAAMMRIQTDPGEIGSESLATALNGELERLRYVIQRLIGSQVTYWYEAPPSSISDIVASFGTGLSQNRIVSGKTTGNSSQLAMLTPSGAAATLTLDATPTEFVYYIAGVQYTISADVVLTGMGLAPGTNNTCLVDVAAAADQQYTKSLGMYGTTLKVDNMGSEITALVGKYAAFKTDTEYFIAFVKSSTELTDIQRGCFFDPTLTRLGAAPLSNNDTITLMRLTWIFVTTAGALAITYANPVVSAVQPTSPSIGDYWFDMIANEWKIFNSTAYVSANALLVGMSIQDTTNCVAARAFDSFIAHDPLNTMELELASTTVVRSKSTGAEVGVFGSFVKFGNSRLSWDITANRDSGISEDASTIYYLYIKESGVPVMSSVAPLHMRERQGLYHPHETWRCVGWILNSSGSDLVGYPQSLRGKPSVGAMMMNSAGYDPTITTPAGTKFPRIYDQYYSNPNTLGYFAVNGTLQDLATIAFSSPGLFMISAKMRIIPGTNGFGALLLIGDTAGNSTSGQAEGLNDCSRNYLANANPETDDMIINSYIVAIDAPTSLYLKGSVTADRANIIMRAFSYTVVRLSDLSGSPT